MILELSDESNVWFIYHRSIDSVPATLILELSDESNVWFIYHMFTCLNMCQILACIVIIYKICLMNANIRFINSIDKFLNVSENHILTRFCNCDITVNKHTYISEYASEIHLHCHNNKYFLFTNPIRMVFLINISRLRLWW